MIELLDKLHPEDWIVVVLYGAVGIVALLLFIANWLFNRPTRPNARPVKKYRLVPPPPPPPRDD